MKSFLRAVGLIVVALFAGACWDAGAAESLASDLTPNSSHMAASGAGETQLNSPSEDDLLWLVGRWRCYVRRYLGETKGPLGGSAEDTLDYFNVYFPYADDRLTLLLTNSAQDRPLAAEFLVRRVVSQWPNSKDSRPLFREVLSPMSPLGPVSISKDFILIGGFPSPGSYGFRYKLENRGHDMWLILESKVMHLELLKISAEIEGIKDSFVDAPIKDYSPERIQKLKHQYGELTKSIRSTGPVAAPPARRATNSPQSAQPN